MPRAKLNNNRVKITTLLDQNLFKQAKIRAAMEGYEGANSIIEKALKLYMGMQGRQADKIWEKSIESGFIERLTIGNDKAVFELISKSEIIKLDKSNKDRYSPKSLKKTGYKKIE